MREKRQQGIAAASGEGGGPAGGDGGAGGGRGGSEAGRGESAADAVGRARTIEFGDAGCVVRLRKLDAYVVGQSLRSLGHINGNATMRDVGAALVAAAMQELL